MTKATSPGLRILVGAGSFADAAAAIRLVQQLPSSFCMGLGGVLVEEVDMLATCQIPDQRIVLLSGMTTMAPNRSQVRTLLKADARAFQRCLAQAADPSGTSWVFAQDKGDLVATALRAAAGWDVLVLGYRHIHSVPGKIILLETSGPASTEMHEASRRLSQQLAADHAVFSVKKNAGDTLRPTGSNTVQFDTLDESLNALTRTNAHAVLVDLRHGPLRNQNDLSSLLEAARCPVIVFGASNTHLLLEHSTQIPPRPALAERESNS